jgi:G3E family GTPase
MDAPAPEFTPVHLITGFLGAGKTTLLQRLLAQPALADAAVLINEFGEIGLDHLLLERLTDDVVLLASGCICCSVRGELADALRALNDRRACGELPWFRRVVIESSGLADPFPIVSTLHADTVLRHHFRLGRIVTVVDALHGAMQLDSHEQSVKQAAVADHLVLTKVALAGAPVAQALIERLARINPLAPLHDAEADSIDATDLLGGEADDGAVRWVLAKPWLAREEVAAADEAESQRYLGGLLPPTPKASRHHADLRAFAITLDAPLDWTGFGLWLSMLVHRHGADILRIKCILDVQGSDTPVAVHGVQHLVHPPLHLAAWPDATRQSRLVFIARGLDGAVVERSLRAFVGG